MNRLAWRSRYQPGHKYKSLQDEHLLFISNDQDAPGLFCVRQEQRGPVTVFSVSACPQVQCKADFLPQEHLACFALVTI